jgi:hypothetical protein
MPSIINNDPDGGAFQRTDWKEMIAGWKPGGPDVFGDEQSEAVLVGLIPFELRYSFLRAVLGYSYLENYQLVRILPLRHSWFSWLYATSATIEAIQPDSESAETLKRDAFDPDMEFDFAGYTKAKAVIRFAHLPYEVLDDDEISTYGSGLAEWERYCYDAEREGSLEIISQTGRTLKFAEGVIPGGAPKGYPFPTEVGTFAYKTALKFVWKKVAREYVCGTDEFDYSMPKIDAAVGKLNATAFLGYERGELLMNPPTITRFLWPLVTTDTLAYGYDIGFNLQIFRPESGVTPQAYFGHNLMPWGGRINDTQSAAPNTPGIGKWFFATDNGEVTGEGATGQLPYHEFRDCFKAAEST